MKKFILFIFIIFLTSIKVANAEIRMIDRTGYAFTVDGKYTPFNLYYDDETNYPLFRLDYGTEYEEGFFFESTNDSIYSESELETIKESIYYITDGRKFSELSITELIGIQALIWDIYSTHTDKVLNWTCDIGFLVDYRPKMALKKELHDTPAIYNYETRVNTPLKVAFLPFFKNAYSLSGTYAGLTFTKNANEIVFNPTKEGSYTYEITSDSFNEDVRLFKGEHSSLIELVKMRDTAPIININVLSAEEKPEPVNVSAEPGIDITFSKDTYYENEDVTFNYTLKEGYELSSITYEINGTSTNVTNNTFKYQKDGILKITTKKIPVSHSITIISDNNVLVKNTHLSSIAGTKIELDYELLNAYTLDRIELITSTKTITLDSNTFIMPSDNVFIHFVLKENKKYQLFYQNDIVSVDLKSSYSGGEVVNINPVLKGCYVIDSIYLYTENGGLFKITANTFTMPSSNAYLKILTTNISDEREKTKEEDPKKYMSTTSNKSLDDVPKTGDNEVLISPRLILLTILSLIGISLKLTKKV